jgi:prevent-host-death family protein
LLLPFPLNLIRFFRIWPPKSASNCPFLISASAFDNSPMLIICFSISRNGGETLIRGSSHSQSVNKSLAAGDQFWLQNSEFGLLDFLRSKEKNKEFIVIKFQQRWKKILTNYWYQTRLTRLILKGGIMESVWKLQDAKSQFSKVVQNALKSGPQYVTRRGTKAVVVLSVRDYEKLISNKLSFKDFLLGCPKMDEDFQIERQKDYPRNIEL